MKETALFEIVTPERAQAFLDSSTGNRFTRKWWVEALSSALRRGEWITTHQGFAFSESGRFLDGHHRAQAIVKSGVSVRALVVRGIDDNAFKVTDVGIKRTVSDTTGLSKTTSEVCRLASQYVNRSTVSAQQVLDIANTGLAEIHDRLKVFCGTSKKFYGSTPMRLAACILVMDGEPEQYVFDVYRNLVLEQFLSLPPVCHSLIKQVNSGVAKANETPDVLARGLKAMNPRFANAQKLQCSSDDAAAARDLVRTIMNRSMA